MGMVCDWKLPNSTEQLHFCGGGAEEKRPRGSEDEVVGKVETDETRMRSVVVMGRLSILKLLTRLEEVLKIGVVCCTVVYRVSM